MAKRSETHNEFMDVGRKELDSVDFSKCRSLSSHISFVGTLHSNKWKLKKSKNKEILESTRVIGYRFKTDVDISDIVRFDILKPSSTITTDPNGYKRNGTFDVKAGDEFDLNLFETAVFFMRDDIFGEISGGGNKIILYTLTTSKDYLTISLKSSNGNIKENEIYIDFIEDGNILPLRGFEKFNIIYRTKKGVTVNYKEDKSAITVCGLRNVLDESIWK